MAVSEFLSRRWQRITDPGWVRPMPTPAQRRVDVLLVAAFVVVAAVSSTLIHSMASAYGGGAPLPWPQQVLWILGFSIPLIWRRRFPAVVAMVVAGVFLASQLLGFLDNLMASVALFWTLYSVGAWSRSRRRAFWVRCAIVIAMFGLLVVSLVQYQHDPAVGDPSMVAGPLDPAFANVLYSLLVNVGYFAAATFFGTSAWTSAKRQQQLTEQAEALAAAQQVGSQRAVMRERVHIARELHDVVAHHVSVMGVQASAARRVLGKSPELASDALSAVENTARVAITELRGLLGVLRDVAHEDDDDRPVVGAAESFHAAPGLDQIPELVAHGESAGLIVRYGVFGERRAVSSGVSLSLFRIVQEALTNVIKHAAATTVDVRLRYRDSSVEIEITDDGASNPRKPMGQGFGLVGMRERVAVHHGELVVGPRPDGGFRVRADLPYVVDRAETAAPVDEPAGIGALDG